MGTGEQEELIDIQTDNAAKIKHKECSCPINFWLTMESSYPNPATHAVPHLLIIPSTWECEQGFSALISKKSEDGTALLRLGMILDALLSKVITRIDQLVEKKPTTFIIVH